MRTVKHLIYYMTLLATVLLSACSSDETTDTEQPLPEGMGRIRMAICTPEALTTRAVAKPNAWETPDHDWEIIQSYRILICDEDNNIVQVIHRNLSSQHVVSAAASADSTYKTHDVVVSQPLLAKTYNIYAVANLSDYSDFDEGKTIDLNKTVRFPNGYSATSDDYFGEQRNIPMTGRLVDDDGKPRTVTVTVNSTTDAGTITVWRVMAKLQFEFTNLSDHKIRVFGVEVDPINQASDDGPGIYLFSKDNLASVKNLAPYNNNEPVIETGVTATWPLHDDATITTPLSGTVEKESLITKAQLSWGNKLTPAGLRQITDAIKMQMFQPTVKLNERDEEAAIILTVKPGNDFTFTPKKLSFKACRGGTDAGNFDVLFISGGTTTVLATGEQPARYNLDPFTTDYNYPLNATPTTGDVVVKICVYNLDTNKDYAFSDIVITGDVEDTNKTTVTTVEKLTLPPAPAGNNKKSGREDVGTVRYELPSASPLELNASGGTQTFFFYVNETDATFTTTNNQLSLRFKIQRQKGDGTWENDEIRYGMTSYHNLSTNEDFTYGGSNGGFNVIRRNDWIHIPVVLTDWQLRIEPLALVPIGGYPNPTVSSDGLTAKFETGGMIALQPFVKQYSDTSWHDFGDSRIELVDVSWRNRDGRNVSGDDKIVKTAFAYDPATNSIIGELSQDPAIVGNDYMTTFSISVKLGNYDYNFTFNVILD